MKHQITWVFLVYFLLCSFYSFSQTEATTKDGRKVVLYKNGTWKYVKTSTTTPSSVPAKSEDAQLKKEAVDFSMNLVHSYFSKDCSVLLNSLSQEIITFKGMLSKTEEVKSKLCEAIQTAIRDSSKTFIDYEKSYKVQLMSKQELEAKYKTTLPGQFDVMSAEYYFIGLELKPEVTNTHFVANGLLALLIRKTGDKWEVKGFLED